jgi:hypothetical protein
MKAESVFEPMVLAIVTDAFRDTCRELPALPDESKALLARRILGTASLGERDRALLRNDAIAYFEG